MQRKFLSGNLQPAWYRASNAEIFAVLARYWHKHGLPPARLRKVTWLEVVHWYWRGTEYRYHASTKICTGLVLELLRSRLLFDFRKRCAKDRLLRWLCGKWPRPVETKSRPCHPLQFLETKIR